MTLAVKLPYYSRAILSRRFCPILDHLVGEKAEAHQLFQLTAANHGKLPVPMYVELDLYFFSVIVPKSWGSYYQEPSEL